MSNILPQILPQILTRTDIGRELANMRKDAGLKQKEIAISLKISGSSISRFENGVRLTSGNVTRILKFLNEYYSWTDEEYERYRKKLCEPLECSAREPTKAADSLEHLKYIGKYYMYAFATAEECGIDKYEIVVQSRLNKLVVASTNFDLESRETYEYDGEMFFDEHNLYIEMNGLTYSERILCIFINPITKSIAKLMGIMAFTSIVNEPAVRVCLFTKDYLTEDGARSVFIDKGWNYKNSVIKIHATTASFGDSLVVHE